MKNLLTLLLFIKLVLFSEKTNATNYYFSSADGDDSRTSTQAQSSSTPWKTLSKLNSFFGSLQAGDNVYFKRGDVFYGSINVTKASVNFGAYGSGNKPIITGLTDVSGWTSVGSNLWESSAVSNGQSTAMIVLVSGTYYPMGRYPNANTTNGGYLTYESYSGVNSITDAQLSSSPNWTGAEVVVRKSTWVTDKGIISSHSGGTLNFTPTAGNNAQGVNGSGYFIQNDVRTLDQQGEWYYNPSTKKLTVYWPGTPPATQISTVTTILDGGSKSSVSFDNLVFKGSTGRMINIPSTSGFTFTNCDFQDAGEDAIWCSSASNLDIENCTLTNTNNNGIIGSGLSTFTLKNTVANTIGVYAGMTNQRSNYSCEGYHVSGNNMTIQNNSVINTGFNAIYFQGNNVSVKNNYVDTYCQVKGDGAGIYTWTGSGSSTSYSNRVVDGNIVMNAIGATNGSPNPSNDALIDAGIYMDDFTQNVTIINNTIANVPKGLYLHNAYNLTVRNNTIYNNTYAGIVPRYDGGHVISNVTITANKIVQKSSTVVCFRYKSQSNDLTSSGTADSNYYARPMADNTTLQTEVPGSTLYTLPQFQTSFSAREKNSKKSPKTITSAGDLRFEYNAGTSTKTVNLGATYMDVTGANYAGSISLAPYTSSVLIYVSGTVTNQPPTTSAGPDQSLTLPTNSTTLSGSASDPDGTISSYQWTKVTGPSQATVASPTLAKTVINNLVEGVYQFELKVTDNSGSTAKDTVQVTVNPSSNQAPVANAGSTQIIILPVSTAILDGTKSTDPDGTIVSYQWTKILGPSSAIILTPTLATTTVTTLTQGVFQFELKVTDDKGAVGKDTVSLTVNAANNQAPIANAGSDINITLPLNSVTLNGSGSDADGSIASYQWTKISGPSQYSILSPAQAQTSVTSMAQGIYQFELKVTDNLGATDRDTLQVVVNAAPPNQTPTAVAGPDINITLPNNSITLSGSGTDPDGTIIAYQWRKISGPSQYNILSSTQSQTTVNNLAEGSYQFELKVTDNQGGTGTDTITVTVNAAPNQSPVADAGPDVTITLPTNTATLNGSGNDPDGTIASYQWSKISGPSQYIIVSAAQAQTTINNLVQGVYQFELKVTDNDGATATSTVQVTVNLAPNQPPVADAGSDVAITLPTNTVTLFGSGNDPDGSIISYQWTKTSGPSQYNIVSATQAQTTINNLAQGVYQFQLKVTDNSGATATSIVQVTVTAAANQPPVADAGSDVVITLPTNTAILTGTGNDPDGTITSYQWTKVSGPSQYAIASATQAQTDVNNLAQGIYAFEFKITDNSGATATDTVHVIVNAAAQPPNQAPTANAGSDITITLPVSSASLNGSGSDADGTITSYQWTKISGPSQYRIRSSRQAQTTASNLSQGVYLFELAITDNSGAMGRDTVQVTVNAAPVNQPPVANAGPDVTITLPVNNVTLIGGGNDPDGTIASYQWSKISGPNQYLIVSPTQAQTTINNLTQGIYSFVLRVTDNSGTTARDTVRVTVNPAPNQPPVANAGADISITLPVNNATLNGSGNDPDGSIASYLWTKISGPSQYSIVSASSGQTTINNLVQGVYQFALTVTDDQGATATATVNVTVNAAANLAPTANAGADINITLPVNSVTLNGSGNDPDGSIASYQWSKISGPSQYVIVSATQSQTSVNNLVEGVYLFELTVTDDQGATATSTVSVTVSAAANQPPVANAGADISITLPVNSVTLIGSGNDPDGSIASYQWSKISGPFQYVLAAPGQPQTGVNNLAKGTYRFELRVTDNHGGVGRDTITVTINAAANQPPVANAGGDITITLPVNSVTVTGSGSDPDGTIASYRWAKASGPSQYSIATSIRSKTNINNLAVGVYTFELTVTDNSGATGKDTVQVTVNNAAQPVNQAPVANAGNDINITLPVNSVTLNGGGNDADGTIASYQWTKIAGPSQYNIVSASQAQTVVNNLAQGTYRFAIRVTDNKGATARDTVQVTVNAAPPNQAPTAVAGTDIVITLPTNSVTLPGSATDPDGTIASYQWTKISGPTQYTIVSPTQPQTDVTNLVQGIYSFQLRVTDNQGAVGRDTITVTVNAVPNQFPIANAGSDITITLPLDSTILNGSGTDPDGTIASYKWTKISGPSQYAIASSTQSQTKINTLAKGVYQFELSVTDNSGASARDTIRVTVNPSNQEINLAPVANAGPDMDVTLPANSVILAGSAVDSDGTIASYQWTKIAGPIDYTMPFSSDAQITVSDLVEGEYQFELKVTDNLGAIGRDTIKVTVNQKLATTAKIYPNPATDQINIQIKSSLKDNNTNLRIYDSKGLIVYQENFIRGQQVMTKQINVAKLLNGVYYVEMNVDPNKIMTLMFVKQ